MHPKQTIISLKQTYNFKVSHVGLMLTTKQKPTVDTQKLKRKESKYTSMKTMKSQGKAAKEEQRTT